MIDISNENKWFEYNKEMYEMLPFQMHYSKIKYYNTNLRTIRSFVNNLKENFLFFKETESNAQKDITLSSFLSKKLKIKDSKTKNKFKNLWESHYKVYTKTLTEVKINESFSLIKGKRKNQIKKDNLCAIFYYKSGEAILFNLFGKNEGNKIFQSYFVTKEKEIVNINIENEDFFEVLNYETLNASKENVVYYKGQSNEYSVLYTKTARQNNLVKTVYLNLENKEKAVIYDELDRNEQFSFIKVDSRSVSHFISTIFTYHDTKLKTKPNISRDKWQQEVLSQLFQPESLFKTKYVYNVEPKDYMIQEAFDLIEMNESI